MPIPTLVHQVATEEDALRFALDYDVGAAERDDPWCLETRFLQPERIVVKWYPSVTEFDGSSYGRGMDPGPIWVVTIRGAVQYPFLDSRAGPRSKSGGLYYEVAQRTGRIIGVGGISREWIIRNPSL